MHYPNQDVIEDRMPGKYINIYMYEWLTEKGKNDPIHLIDNRCKDLGKGVKGHCCHGNSVWVNANRLGRGIWLEVGEKRREARIKGHYFSFLHKGTTSSFLLLPPDSWWDSRLHRFVGIGLCSDSIAQPTTTT